MLISVIIIVVAFCVAEFLARVVVRRGKYYPWLPRKREFLEVDRETHPQLPPTCEFIVNSSGERGDEPQKSLGTEYYALAVGGSAVECYLLDQEVAWPQALQNDLMKPEALAHLGCASVHVGNIGKSGVDSSTLDYMLSKVLPRYDELDLLLIMVGASDVLRWLEKGAPKDSSAEPLKVGQCFECHPEVKLGIRLKELGLIEMYRRWRDSRPKRRKNAAKWLGKARQMRVEAKEFIDVIPDYQIVKEAFLEHFSSVLKQSVAKAKRVMVIGQPWFEKDVYTKDEEALFWNGGVGKAYKEEVSVYYTSRVISEMMKEIDKEAKMLCDKYVVEYVDLRSVVESSIENYRDHFHFLPKASLKVAQIVAEKILSK